MKHVVEAGTDAASLLLFDPAALPDDFDSRVKDDPIEMFEELSKEGRIHHLDTGADGGYLLHAYVDEPVPESLKQYAHDPIVLEKFSVPSGKLYFTGADYGFKNDDSMLKGYPHMGGFFEVAPGDYRVTLHRTEYPDNLHEEKLREQVSPLQFKLHSNMGCFIGLAVLAFLCLAASFFFTSWRTWLCWFLPVTLAFMCLPVVVSQLPPVKAAKKKWDALNRGYPTVIAELNGI